MCANPRIDDAYWKQVRNHNVQKRKAARTLMFLLIATLSSHVLVHRVLAQESAEEYFEVNR